MEFQGNILIIERDAPARALLLCGFEKEGFAVSSSPNAATGLGLAEKDHPDIVLLDAARDEEDGIAMLKRLRAEPWGAHIPVIMLIGGADKAWISEALASGAYEFLIKSDWEIGAIVAFVKNRLTKKPS